MLVGPQLATATQVESVVDDALGGLFAVAGDVTGDLALAQP